MERESLKRRTLKNNLDHRGAESFPLQPYINKVLKDTLSLDIVSRKIPIGLSRLGIGGTILCKA